MLLFKCRSAIFQTLRSCQSGAWISSTPSGAYLYFNAETCPPGWVEANGLNGTVNLRGYFIRSWSNGSAVDAGRSLASIQSQSTYLPAQIRGIYWGFTTTGEYGGNPSTTPNSIPVTDDAFRPATGEMGPLMFDTVAGPSVETKPKNIALLTCMKK